jgi:quercetin dioxygenase-like cupin family protein
VLLVAVGALLWTTRPTAPPAPPRPPAFAELEQVHGETFVLSQAQRRPALAGQVLLPGQGIATEGIGSEAVVKLRDAVRLKLSGDTMVFTSAEADDSSPAGPRIVLEQGDLLVEVTRSLHRRKMSVQTRQGVAIAETEEAALHLSDGAGVIVVRGEVTFIHRETGQAVRLHGGQYLAAPPGGEPYAATFFGGSALVWTTFPRAGLGTTAVGYGLAFAPDGSQLAAVGRPAEAGVRVGPLDESRPVREFTGERCIAFSPDGKLLATTSQAAALVLDAETGETVHTLVGRDRRMRPTVVAFAPDGRTLAVGRSWVNEPGEVECWDVVTGTLRHSSGGHAAGVTCLAFSPDGQLLASGSRDRTVAFWDVATGREQGRLLAVPSQVIWALAFAPDGQTLAIATGASDFRIQDPGEVKLWDRHSGSVRPWLRGHSRAVTSVAYSPDGHTLITGSADTTVRFWDAGTGREYGLLKGHTAAPGFEALVVALAPGGDFLATASMDRTVKLWKTTRTQNDARTRVSVLAALDRGRPLW